MSQELPVNDFKWVNQEQLLKFNEDLMKIVIHDIFLK